MGRTELSARELGRVEVMGRVKAGSLRLREAAELLELSYRQTKRVWARYRGGGAKALQHGNCGRVSNRAHPAEFRRVVVERVRERYADFGATLASEHLASDDGLKIHAESLRRWMREAGLWRRQRKRRPYRQRRERKPHAGELVQLDGSFHRWLEDRGGEACLMHMIDDATSTMQAQFSKQETIWAAVHLLRRWIERYGVPRALYTDWKNVYVRAATERERWEGIVPVTQFGRMCQRLGIGIIAASSPQAKGRVERNHGTHQDRLIKKMGRKKIATHEAANRYLQEEYLADHNERFAREPAEPQDYHRKRPSARELEQVFCLETERSISNDWVVRYENRYFQLERTSDYPPRQAKVTVCEWEDGRVEIRYQGKARPHREIEAPTPRPPAPIQVGEKPPARRSPWKPAASHPWRRAGQAGAAMPRATASAAP